MLCARGHCHSPTELNMLTTPSLLPHRDATRLPNAAHLHLTLGTNPSIPISHACPLQAQVHTSLAGFGGHCRGIASPPCEGNQAQKGTDSHSPWELAVAGAVITSGDSFYMNHPGFEPAITNLLLPSVRGRRSLALTHRTEDYYSGISISHTSMTPQLMRTGLCFSFKHQQTHGTETDQNRYSLLSHECLLVPATSPNKSTYPNHLNPKIRRTAAILPRCL